MPLRSRPKPAALAAGAVFLTLGELIFLSEVFGWSVVPGVIAALCLLAAAVAIGITAFLSGPRAPESAE